ncbi:hypothetical protein [Brevundimonas sp.]|uniref:hypothetical protein n=1 Tax=Brevundimonas sp. TaxID=1871086 RepID=UPI002FC58A58
MSQSWFGRLTTNRTEAFPELKSLALVVRQDPQGMHAQHSWQTECRFDETNFPDRITCVNARCQQGGLELETIIRHSSSGERRYACNGHEGSPAGRRKGDPCDNYFVVDMSVERSRQ